MKVISSSLLKAYPPNSLRTSLGRIISIFYKSLESLRLLFSNFYSISSSKIKKCNQPKVQPILEVNRVMQQSISFLDLRAVSPTIEVPTGLTNPSSNSFFHASLHFFNHHQFLWSHLMDMLENISNDDTYEFNPFYPSSVLESFSESRQKEFISEIAKTLEDYKSLNSIDVQLLPQVPKINLQSFYFHLDIKKAAKIAFCFLKKWQGMSDKSPKILSSRESQLLRLSLVKLIYKNSDLFIENEHRKYEKSIGIPGISKGIHPLSRHPHCSYEFIDSLMNTVFNYSSIEIFLQNRSYIQKKHDIYTARSFMLGKKIKSIVKFDFLNFLTINSQENLDIETLLLKMQSKIDSRGVWQAKKNCFKQHPIEVLDSCNLTSSNSSSLFHEILETSLNLQKYVVIQIQHPSYVKHHNFSLTLSAPDKLSFIFSNAVYNLKCFIAEAGSCVDSSKTLIYVLKESSTKQKVFFKCDDLSVCATSHNSINQIFQGQYKDTHWGQARPVLLLFEQSTIHC